MNLQAATEALTDDHIEAFIADAREHEGPESETVSMAREALMPWSPLYMQRRQWVAEMIVDGHASDDDCDHPVVLASREAKARPVRVQHSHGVTERFASLEAAIEGLRAVYGLEIETEGELGIGSILVWQDAETATDDDGTRAVARIWAAG